MNKKVLAISITLLMILGTLLYTTAPVYGQITPLTLNFTSGAAGLSYTITAPAGSVSAGRDVFVAFDKELADADLGAQLYPFGAITAATGYGYVLLPTWTSYAPGMAIYINLLAPDPGVLVVSPGDTRLTPVTHVNVPGTATASYAAGTVVQPGDFDINDVIVAMPPNVFWTAVGAAHAIFSWAAGDGIYIREATNAGLLPAPGLVGAGDLRARYPSLTVTIPGTALSVTYAAWTKVKSPVINFYKDIYDSADNTVNVGDTRLTNIVVSQLRYPAGTTVLAGAQDAALATTAFDQIAPGYDCFDDLNNDGVWNPGEQIYFWTGAAPFSGFVKATDIRESYVSGTSAAGVQYQYLPFTAVVGGDLDIGTPVKFFPLTQSFVDELAVPHVPQPSYTYGEWIYNVAGAGVTTGATRASAVDWTDKALANNAVGVLALTFPAAELWATDWSNVVAYLFGTVIAGLGEADVGRTLSTFAPTDKRVGAVGAYAPTMPVYRDVDGDNWVSIGDVRESLIYTATARPYGAYPVDWTGAAQQPNYYPLGSTVAAGAIDLPGAGLLLRSFLATERYYDPAPVDLVYLGGDIVGYGGTNAAGNAMPFPVVAAPALPAPIPFTVPGNTLPGNHAVFLITDQVPGGALLAPYTGAGLLSTQLTGAGGVKVAVAPLPWYIDPGWAPTVVAGIGNLGWGTQAGFAIFTVNVPLQVFLHPGVTDPYKPGVWSHTLDTVWGTQGGAAQTREFTDHYLDYAILASASDSIGDFQFDFTVLAPINYIQIFVPPDFQFTQSATIDQAIWTDITNDNQFIWSQTLRAYDPIAPNWVRITIGMDEWWGGLMTIMPATYHVRLFHLRAPTVAGLYHFKIYYSAGGTYIPLSIGAGNYPVVVVKTELNPAIIYAMVRTHLGIAPPFVSGSVLAQGTTPEGRSVEAIGYWGPMEFLGLDFTPGAIGTWYGVWIVGAAAGTYTFTAQASGYNPTTTDRYALDPGQSFVIRIVIYDSPDVEVTIWSKHGSGAIPWHNLWQMPYGTNDPAAAPNNALQNRDILIELYDSSNALISFWASNTIPTAPKIMSQSNRLFGLHDDNFPIGGTIPTNTNYHAWLVDNWDVLGFPRGYPSTHWDGHVPWNTADYIAGWPNGQYSVEAFVTGYIMDEADAAQRTFLMAGTRQSLQFDLRRSNWIETALHMPQTAGGWVVLSGPTTVAMTAEDSGGNERASVAFLCPPAWAADGVINGVDVSLGHLYTGGIIMEGWNAVFPNVGTYYNTGRAAAGVPFRKDYGLNPTASTHSGGSVALAGNPYTLKLFMADMGVPYAGTAGTGFYSIVGGDPQVSIFLCNSPTPLSFSIINSWIWISLRSVDFEVPAHPRPWTLPASEIWVEFLDMSGAAVDWLDPTMYGLVQDAGRALLGAPGTSFNIVGVNPITGNNPAGVHVGWGVTPFDIDNEHAAGQHSHLGVNYYGEDYTSPTFGGGAPIYRALIDLRPTRLPPGEYTFNAYTHGYVMRRSFAVQVNAGIGSDIEADLIQGGEIRVIVNFKHEGIAVAFNGFLRVEVFNENNELVGANVYGMGNPNIFTQTGFGGAYLPYNLVGAAGPAAVNFDHQIVPGASDTTDFGLPVAAFPSSDPSVRRPTRIAPGVFGAPWLATSNGGRGWYSNLFFGVPTTTWAGWLYSPPWPFSLLGPAFPSDANRREIPVADSEAIDVFGFYWYHGDPAITWAGGWPTVDTFAPTGASGYTGLMWDHGIKGSADIAGWPGSGGGKYHMKVWAFDARGPDNAYEAGPLNNDDWNMYYQAFALDNIDLPWGGAVELYTPMNDLAKLRGTVTWLDMYGDVHPLPWAMVSASPGPSTDTTPAFAAGLGTASPASAGEYIMWLPAGTHAVSVSTSEAPQAWTAGAPTQNAEFSVVVSDGWVGGGDTRLGSSGTPVPEIPAFMAPLALIAALAASVWLLRRRNLNIPVWIK